MHGTLGTTPDDAAKDDKAGKIACENVKKTAEARVPNRAMNPGRLTQGPGENIQKTAEARPPNRAKNQEARGRRRKEGKPLMKS